ncbi:MAG: thymidine phosphorylase, partial [Gammaproteobacteria bacterium]
RALDTMNKIIEAQGRQSADYQPGRLVHDVLSPDDGFVVDIDNFRLAQIASFAGAPMDKGAGVDLFKKLGSRVAKGEPLYRIHAEFSSDFNFAIKLCTERSGYRLGNLEQVPSAFVEF